MTYSHGPLTSPRGLGAKKGAHCAKTGLQHIWAGCKVALAQSGAMKADRVAGALQGSSKLVPKSPSAAELPEIQNHIQSSSTFPLYLPCFSSQLYTV